MSFLKCKLTMSRHPVQFLALLMLPQPAVIMGVFLPLLFKIAGHVKTVVHLQLISHAVGDGGSANVRHQLSIANHSTCSSVNVSSNL